MGRREPFQIAGQEIKPGQRATVDIPVADLYTHTGMSMPVHVIHGRRPGPTLFLSAAIHGDEINGVEIIRRLLKLKRIKTVQGTLIAIPVVNVYGFVNGQRYLPDRRDLNRFFPGSSKGSLTSRLADVFMKEIVAKCTHGIDFHSGSNHRVNLPQVRAQLDDSETRKLARAFGAPVALDANLRDGSLRQAAVEHGVPMLLYEAGEALRFDEIAIRVGLRGAMRVMAEIGMIAPRKPGKAELKPVISRSSVWARTPASGILRTAINLGNHVEEGAVLGEVADAFGEGNEKILSPTSGIVIGMLNLPLVHQGDAVFHLAQFEDMPAAESAVEAFQQQFEPDS